MPKETMEFQTEVKKMLDLMINSLYTNREIFLRELISNASDAIDRLRFRSQTDQSVLEGDNSFKIMIEADTGKRVLSVSDNGIGMTREEVISNIGTIAKSGTESFLKAISESKTKELPPELIGQFGVGFYSSFMVADRVVLTTRSAIDKKATRWESKGDGTFTVEDADREKHGTTVTLYLKKPGKDEEDFSQEWTIRSIVKKYSDFVTCPICMNVEREEVPRDKDGKSIEGEKPQKIVREETLNSMKPLWIKSKSEIKDEEYKEFYKHISHDWSEPAETIHVHAEGRTEYRALLFIPSKAPFDLLMPDRKSGIQLFVKNVFIMDNCESLMPQYLRFVKGVVDSSDLSLNISRETLQQDRLVAVIKKNLVKKVFETLGKKQEKDPEKYLEFYREFGRVLKEGLHYDYANREQLQELLIYQSTHGDGYTTLKEYADRMKKGQKDIYYITGTGKEAVKNSPHLEAFKSKGYEVLFMIDTVDEWVMQAMQEYMGKHFKSVTKGEVDLSGDDEKKGEEKGKEEEKIYSSFLEYAKNRLKDSVKEVRISKRLTDSPVCLVSDEQDLSPHMEKILRQMNQEVPDRKRILEVNPGHELLKYLQTLFEKERTNPLIGEYVDILYDQALLSEGSQIKDPVKFSRQISRVMLKAAKL